MNKKIEEKKTGGKKLVVGAGLAALAATAYFFLGPDSKKNQKHFKSWAIKMKGDVLEKLEQAKLVSEPAYHEIIDKVAEKHEKIKKAKSAEIKFLAKDLKSHWPVISKTLIAPVKPATKPVKKVSKPKNKLTK